MDQNLFRLLGPGGERCPPATRPARRRPPRPYPDVARAVLSRITAAHVVLMTAPSGYGKTTLARQFTERAGGLCAWFRCDKAERTAADAAVGILAAVVDIWPDSAGVHVAGACPPENALSALAYVLDDVPGDGVIVVDDIHHLGPGEGRLLVETMLRHLPHEMRLVVAGQEDLGLDLLEGISEGFSAGLDAKDLLFSVDEVEELTGDGDLASVLVERTGGWPLAIGILKESKEGIEVADTGQLRRRALATLGPRELDLLRAVVPLRSVPAGILDEVAAGEAAALAQFARSHPSVLRVEDGRLHVCELIREGLSPSDGSAQVMRQRAAIAQRLEDDEPENAFALHVDSEDWVGASRSLGRCLPAMADAGRWQALGEMADSLPPGHVDEMVRLRLLCARVWSGDAEVGALDALAEEAGRPAVRVGALAAAAHMCLYGGDPTALARAVAPLSDLTAGDLTPAGIERTLGECGAEMLEGICGLVFALATCLLFTSRGEDRVAARRYLEVAEAALDRNGFDSALPVAIHRYIDASSGGLDSELAAASIEKALIRIGDSLPAQKAVLVVLAAELEIATRGALAARARVLEASELAEAYGFGDAALASARIFAETEVILHGTTAAAEELWPAVSGSVPSTGLRGGAEFALRICAATLAGGDAAAATRWLARSRTVAPAHPYSFWWQAALDARMRAMAGEPTAVADLDSTRALMLAAGVERLGNLELVPLVTERAESPVSPTSEPDLVIRVLAPTVRVERGDVTTEIRGIGARLLAILVASDGICELDRATEYLWPEVAPDTGRNRFYVQLHRLRRTLGFGADGPLRCEDGLVRLEAGAGILRVDAWDFLSEASRAELTPAVLELYRDDFCSRQFAYDDVAIAYRSALRRKFVQLVLCGGAQPAAASVWDRISDDPDVALLVCRVLVDNGEPAAAEQVAASTAATMRTRGLDETEFLGRWRACC